MAQVKQIGYGPLKGQTVTTDEGGTPIDAFGAPLPGYEKASTPISPAAPTPPLQGLQAATPTPSPLPAPATPQGGPAAPTGVSTGWADIAGTSQLNPQLGKRNPSSSITALSGLSY